MKTLFRTLAVAALLAAPFSASAQTATLPVDESFETGSYWWTGGVAGRMYYAWRPVMTADNRMMICGIYSVTDIRLRSPVFRMLRGAVVTADGQPVMRNTVFFKKTNARSTDALLGQNATCSDAGPAMAANEFDMTMGSGRWN